MEHERKSFKEKIKPTLPLSLWCSLHYNQLVRHPSVVWYWYRCPNGDKLLLRSNGVKNLGTCPYCHADWIRITDPDEIEAIEKRAAERAKLARFPEA